MTLKPVANNTYNTFLKGYKFPVNSFFIIQFGLPCMTSCFVNHCLIFSISGKKSNDQVHPDYVPSIHMGGYNTATNGELRAARFERSQKREEEKDRHQAATALLAISENLPPATEPTEGNL